MLGWVLQSGVPCTPGVPCTLGCCQPSPDTSPSLQAVEELLESLDLEKSSYHMGLSRVWCQMVSAGAGGGTGQGWVAQGRDTWHGTAWFSAAWHGAQCKGSAVCSHLQHS